MVASVIGSQGFVQEQMPTFKGLILIAQDFAYPGEADVPCTEPPVEEKEGTHIALHHDPFLR